MQTDDTAPARRSLSFASPQEVIDDCQNLSSAPCRMLGQWTLSQNIRHLAQGVDCFYDGFGFQLNWWRRRILGPLLKHHVLRRGMPQGVRLPVDAGTLLPPAPDDDLPAALEHLKSAIRRLEQEAPRHPHPFFGPLTHEQARQFMLRHAELHLSFAIPAPEPAPR
ncbi:hypothetical protein Pan44_13290 [Caulifigura coniformis]|uniref:DinB superfamily protein n=1 Tax=Caulifigura coniformis TaxID=2527983 RepID=A0A517SB04_9PLAN|nr:DUF1569 domain-containing protein [Caulifigura coniformis]QDT53313.1 hypothetical protein Pan44_13290 [Caulifigura coniformis]